MGPRQGPDFEGKGKKKNDGGMRRTHRDQACVKFDWGGSPPKKWQGNFQHTVTRSVTKSSQQKIAKKDQGGTTWDLL